MPDRLVLSGLDAANPLGYLAAIGTLHGLARCEAYRGSRLAWESRSGTWRPILVVDDAGTAQPSGDPNDPRAAIRPPSLGPEFIVGMLVQQLRRVAHCPALAIGKDLNIEARALRAAAHSSAEAACRSERLAADFIAAFGSDVIEDSKTGLMLDTDWRTMSGAGHQHFLEFMRILASETDEEHVRRALFEPWTYADPPPSLRWDPVDDRRYALRWDKPATDPIRTVRGANALAILGLPMFPTQPTGHVLATTGFQRIPSRRGIHLTWPIWEPAITLDTVRAVLTLPELQREHPPRHSLQARGIVEIYRSQRITQGKYRNFTLGHPA